MDDRDDPGAVLPPAAVLGRWNLRVLDHRDHRRDGDDHRPGNRGHPVADRDGNPDGKHELTLVDRAGALISVLTPDVDVADIGLGCSD